MANVLNRTTKQYLTSVNTPDYPIAEWIVNPDISLVEGQPTRYWNISGDSVSLMSQAEMDAVDATILAAQVLTDKTVQKARLTERLLKALIVTIMNEINILRANDGLPDRTITQLKNAIEAEVDNG